MLISCAALAALVGMTGIVTLQRSPRSRVPDSSRKLRRTRRSHEDQRELDVGMLVTQVATRLRSGATVEDAWKQSLGHYGVPSVSNDVIGADGVPRPLRELWQAPFRKRMLRGKMWRHVDSLPATFAVCRMGHATGAPMAEILDACAEGITEAGESRSAREVALAGPQTSARMLAALPVVGIGVGYVLGVDPLSFLLHTVVGNIALIAGVICEIVGLVMVHRMVSEAKRAEVV